MINQLRKLFDWKANPASVFIIAIPLAGIGLGTGFLVALLHWVAGDPVYMFIFFGILAISLPTFWSLLWNHLMFYGLQATMSEFWIQDDPYDRPNCVLPSKPPCRRVK